MDWSKSKNVLIFALLITNIILLFFVYRDQRAIGDGTLTRSFVQDTIKMLEEKDIHIDAKIPRRNIKLNSLSVEFEKKTPEELNQGFFDNKGTVLRVAKDLIKMDYKNESISIVNNRRILYENRRKSPGGKAPSKEESLNMVQEFLRTRDYPDGDMILTFYKKEKDQAFLEYSKTYEEVLVESSYTNFVVDKDGVRSMDRLWLNVIEISNNDIALASAPKALLSFLDQPKYYHRRIETLDPCYYFNPEEQGYVEDLTKARQGRAIPAWRVQFQDGEKVVIDIY
ncbi:MAG: two-component system regulatory protein YycI [Tissierellia bacterium]|nr:two-component system regulatory protein YycI [Tissierellia bacterium]